MPTIKQIHEMGFRSKAEYRREEFKNSKGFRELREKALADKIAAPVPEREDNTLLNTVIAVEALEMLSDHGHGSSNAEPSSEPWSGGGGQFSGGGASGDWDGARGSSDESSSDSSSSSDDSSSSSDDSSSDSSSDSSACDSSSDSGGGDS